MNNSMNKYIAILCFSLLNTLLFTQNISDEDISFKYKKLPLNPLNNEFIKYTVEVEIPYEEEDKKKLEEFQSKKSKTEEEYKKEKEEYKNTSFGDKFAAKLLNQDIKPTKEQVEKPYVRKLFDKALLASSYIQLDGYEKSDMGDFKVVFVVHGIEWADYKVNESSNYSTGTKSYSAAFTYRSPISIKVQKNDGTIIFSETVPMTNEFKSYSSSSFGSREIVYEKARPEVIVTGYEQKMVDDNMKLANLYLNDRCAKSFTATRKLRLYNISSKKEDFKDYETAFLTSMEGYYLLSDNYESAIEKIKSSISLWEEAIKDYTPTDKSSTRINNDVYLATVNNLANAYSFTNDFAKAKMMIAKVKTMDLSKKEIKRLDEIKLFIDDQEERYEANNPE